MAQCVALVQQQPPAAAFTDCEVQFSFKPGRAGNKLKSHDAALYKRLCNSSSLAFARLLYCKRVLGGEEGEGQGALNHDFLVLHLLNNGADHHYILAEKSFPGIYIDWCKAPNPNVIAKVLDCESSAIGLRDIEKILENFKKEYHPITSNCKDYARAVSKNLVYALPISDDHKQSLIKSIDDIPWRVQDE